VGQSELFPWEYRCTGRGNIEGFVMLTSRGIFSPAGRSAAVAMMAALVLTTLESPLAASPAARTSEGISATVASGDATDFSSARRRRHYHRGGNAAGLAFMGFAIGTIGAAIAAQQRRDDYYYYGHHYGPTYYDGPGYYDGGPYYGSPYYGRRYYYRPW
jgi:hypothetical protein